MIISSRELPIFIMTVGISGAGKSEWIKSMKDFIVISPDNIRKELTGNVNDQSQNEKVWSIARYRTRKALQSGLNVILDATNVDAAQRQYFINRLPPVQLKAKIFNVDPEEAIRRINKAIERGEDRAATPPEIIKKMHEKLTTQSTPEKLQQEGFELL